MNNKIIILCIGILITLFSCKSTEKIGDYRYKVKIEKANTGDYGGIIVTIKSYYLKKELQGGCIIKSQRFGFEKPSDTVFTKGFTFIDQNTKNLKCYEFNYYGYKNFADNTYREFTQEGDGRLKQNGIKTINIVDKNMDLIYLEFDYNKSTNPWVDAFKDRVFFAALREAYQSDTFIFNLIKKKMPLTHSTVFMVKQMKRPKESVLTL